MIPKSSFPVLSDRKASNPITSRIPGYYSETGNFEKLIFCLHLKKILFIILLSI
jgi:hypothetical protein